MALPYPVGDGVEQVGFAQAGLAVNKQGIVGPARLLGHLLGGGVGKAVGGAHYEALEGVALLVLSGGGGGGALGGIGLPLLGEKQRHVYVKGKQLPKGLFHRGLEPCVNDAPLKIGGNAQHQPGVLQGDGLHVAKPGFDGDGGHTVLHQGFHFFPYVSGGFHRPWPPKTQKFTTHILYQKNPPGTRVLANFFL